MTIEQTAGEPVAWALVRNGKVVNLGNGHDEWELRYIARGGDSVRPLVFGDITHPRPRVGVTVTEEMVEAAAKILAYRLVGCTEKGWNGDAVFTAEQKAQILDDARVMLTAALTLADSPAPLANGGGEVARG